MLLFLSFNMQRFYYWPPAHFKEWVPGDDFAGVAAERAQQLQRALRHLRIASELAFVWYPSLLFGGKILISCLGIHFYKMYKFKLPLYTWCSVKHLLERGQVLNLFHLLQHRKIGAAVLCHNAALRLSHCVGCKMDCRIRPARTSVQKVVLSLCCHSLFDTEKQQVNTCSITA